MTALRGDFWAWPCVLLAVVTIAILSTPAKVETHWEQIAVLAQPRSHAVSVRLPDGAILVVGGFDPTDPVGAPSTSEVIDLKLGASQVLPTAFAARVNHTLTVVGDRAISVGGTERRVLGWQSVARVDIFLAWPRVWTSAAPMRSPRSDHGATALRDGRLLVAGGTDGPRQLASVEIYDPSGDQWAEVATLPEPRSQFSIATLRDGRVLVAGGLVRGQPSATSLFYDPRQDKWSAGPTLHVERVLHASTQLANGDLLIVGGQRGASGLAERYDTESQSFMPAGTLVVPRMLARVALLPGGHVLLVGGLPVDPSRATFTPTSLAETWDPVTGLWQMTAAPAVAGALGDLLTTDRGAVRIAGVGRDEQVIGSVERFWWR